MLHIPDGYTTIVYIGEEQNLVFTLYGKKPYPKVNKGDVIVVPKKLLQWIALKRLPYERISPEDSSSVVTPIKEEQEGGIGKKIKRLFINEEKELLKRFEEDKSTLDETELKKLCKYRGITNYSKLHKEEMIDLLTIDLLTPPCVNEE